MSAFTHPSRPGYFGTTFSEDLRARLAALSDALIPGDGAYPSASCAQVPAFIEHRASEDDRARLAAVAERYPFGSPEEAKAALTDLEQTDAATFGWLREYVYHGYYAAPRVLAAMHDRGFDYHGAPQPLGYALPGETARPTVARGSYIPTAEVTRATS